MKEQPEEIFRKHGGQLRMSEAIKQGITRYMLYSLRDRGIIEQVSRGIYRLVDLPPISNPDLVTVSLRFPNAVICLISALSFHEITTQIPHAVSVAVPRDSRKPSLDFPPIVTVPENCPRTVARRKRGGYVTAMLTGEKIEPLFLVFIVHWCGPWFWVSRGQDQSLLRLYQLQSKIGTIVGHLGRLRVALSGGKWLFGDYAINGSEICYPSVAGRRSRGH